MSTNEDIRSLRDCPRGCSSGSTGWYIYCSRFHDLSLTPWVWVNHFTYFLWKGNRYMNVYSAFRNMWHKPYNLLFTTPVNSWNGPLVKPPEESELCDWTSSLFCGSGSSVLNLEWQCSSYKGIWGSKESWMPRILPITRTEQTISLQTLLYSVGFSNLCLKVTD